MDEKQHKQMLDNVRKAGFSIEQLGNACQRVSKIGVSLKQATDNLIGCIGHRKRKVKFGVRSCGTR